jgi:hypothetical protein
MFCERIHWKLRGEERESSLRQGARHDVGEKDKKKHLKKKNITT